MAVVVVVIVVATVGVGVAWHRRHAPARLGEGIAALGRISRHDDVPVVAVRSDPAARRRRQVRLASSLCLSGLAVAWTAGAHHRGWALVFAFVLLLRVAFEMLARRPQDIA